MLTALCDVCAPVCEAEFGSQQVDCDAKTTGTDTYSISLPFSGAGTTTYTVTTTAGTIGGDDPTSNASGNITITGIPEGTNVTITMDDTAGGGLCSLSRDITSPVCEPTGTVDLELQGIIDFTVPSGGNDGKAIHVVATADIADLSVYGIGTAGNGGGTDGQEYTFDAISVNAGDHILVARTISVMESYMTTAGYALFDHVLTATTAINMNGDDAIELFKNGSVVETFGDINVDGSGESWEYMDSWAYKTTLGASWPTGWSYGAVNCTDGSTTILESSCIYPFLETLSTENTSLELIGLYPNPIKKETGYMTILTNSSENFKVVLFDVLGKKLFSQTISNNQLDISNLKAGIYLVRITQDKRQTTKKIIIK